MARKKHPLPSQPVTKANLLNGPFDKPLRFQLSEAGSTGLKAHSGLPLEETRESLQFPQSLRTYKTMAQDPTVGAAIGLYQAMISRSVWNVKEAKNASQEEKNRTKFLRQTMNDMDHTWSDFLQEVSSMCIYGFAPVEKVFRKRLKSQGSKYNDGLIGLKKMAIRSQDTIDKFIYDDKEDGKLIGIRQNLALSNYGLYGQIAKEQYRVLPYPSKVLLFRTGTQRENPVGQSPLRNAYQPWVIRCKIEETEAISVARDNTGTVVITIPAAYMSADATPAQKAIYEEYKKIARNLQAGTQSGVVLPSEVDLDTKHKLFDMQLLSLQGGKMMDTAEIIKRYDNKILTAMMADLLTFGQQGNTGSYNLGSIKTGMVALAVEARLQEIANVLNKQLVPQIYELNGWSLEGDDYPEFVFGDLDSDDTESFSKAIQRMASVNMLPTTRDILDRVRQQLGLDPLPEDFDVEAYAEKAMQSKAGQGMAKGSGNGTSDNVAGQDNSANNADNAA